MNRAEIEAILLADAPDAMVELCGVTLLERWLRILHRLGFRRVSVLSATPQSISAELPTASWARRELTVDLVPRAAGDLTAQKVLGNFQSSGRTRLLVIPAGIYCDSRLLATLCDKNASAVLVDSNPPEFVQPLSGNFPQTDRGRFCGPALFTENFGATLSSHAPLFEQLIDKINQIDLVDAATVPDYIASMRRHLRPLCFPAPTPDNRRLAERLVLETTQNGTLDIPAYAHAPIENWFVSLLWKTRITPNQITSVGFLFGCVATVAFLTGHLWLGTVIALLFGVLDGVDGKLARAKIETTERGKREHQLDYLIENSWWAALAFHLWSSGQLRNAFYFFALLIASDLVDRLAKRLVRLTTARQLDDVAPFDRGFRLIAGRRNIYVWTLAVGLVLGAIGQTYVAICGWAAITAAVHLVRSVWLCMARRSVPI